MLGREARQSLAGGSVQPITVPRVDRRFALTPPDRLAGATVNEFDRHDQHVTMITVDPGPRAPAVVVMPVTITIPAVGLHHLLHTAGQMQARKTVDPGPAARPAGGARVTITTPAVGLHHLLRTAGLVHSGADQQVGIAVRLLAQAEPLQAGRHRVADLRGVKTGTA